MLCPFARALRPQHDVEIITYPKDKSFSYSQLTDLIYPRLEKEQDFALLAESFSGPIAALAVEKGLRGLSALIFAASFIKKPTHLPSGFAAILKMLPIQSKQMLKIARPLTFGRWATTHLEDQLHTAIGSVSLSILRQRVRSVMQIDAQNAVAGFTKPTLYLRPTSDRLIGKVAVRTIKAEINHLEVQELDGPHFILQTQPETSAEIITDFLSRQLSLAQL